LKVNGDGEFKFGQDVTVGDSLISPSGELDVVTSITREELKGAHAPFTLDGTIVVDGFTASVYAHSQNIDLLGETIVSAHDLAHVVSSNPARPQIRR